VQGFLRAGSQMVGGIAAIGIGCYVVAPGLHGQAGILGALGLAMDAASAS